MLLKSAQTMSNQMQNSPQLCPLSNPAPAYAFSKTPLEFASATDFAMAAVEAKTQTK